MSDNKQPGESNELPPLPEIPGPPTPLPIPEHLQPLAGQYVVVKLQASHSNANLVKLWGPVPSWEEANRFAFIRRLKRPCETYQVLQLCNADIPCERAELTAQKTLAAIASAMSSVRIANYMGEQAEWINVRNKAEAFDRIVKIMEGGK